jgi:hypothetical protein
MGADFYAALRSWRVAKNCGNATAPGARWLGSPPAFCPMAYTRSVLRIVAGSPQRLAPVFSHSLRVKSLGTGVGRPIFC